MTFQPKQVEERRVFELRGARSLVISLFVGVTLAFALFTVFMLGWAGVSPADVPVPEIREALSSRLILTLTVVLTALICYGGLFRGLVSKVEIEPDGRWVFHTPMRKLIVEHQEPLVVESLVGVHLVSSGRRSCFILPRLEGIERLVELADERRLAEEPGVVPGGEDARGSGDDRGTETNGTIDSSTKRIVLTDASAWHMTMIGAAVAIGMTLAAVAAILLDAAGTNLPGSRESWMDVLRVLLLGFPMTVLVIGPFALVRILSVRSLLTRGRETSGQILSADRSGGQVSLLYAYRIDGTRVRSRYLARATDAASELRRRQTITVLADPKRPSRSLPKVLFVSSDESTARQTR